MPGVNQEWTRERLMRQAGVVLAAVETVPDEFRGWVLATAAICLAMQPTPAVTMDGAGARNVRAYLRDPQRMKAGLVYLRETR